VYAQANVRRSAPDWWTQTYVRDERHRRTTPRRRALGGPEGYPCATAPPCRAIACLFVRWRRANQPKWAGAAVGLLNAVTVGALHATATPSVAATATAAATSVDWTFPADQATLKDVARIIRADAAYAQGYTPQAGSRARFRR
jgi:hypothetical protein